MTSNDTETILEMMGTDKNPESQPIAALGEDAEQLLDTLPVESSVGSPSLKHPPQQQQQSELDHGRMHATAEAPQEIGMTPEQIFPTEASPPPEASPEIPATQQPQTASLETTQHPQPPPNIAAAVELPLVLTTTRIQPSDDLDNLDRNLPQQQQQPQEPQVTPAPPTCEPNDTLPQESAGVALPNNGNSGESSSNHEAQTDPVATGEQQQQQQQPQHCWQCHRHRPKVYRAATPNAPTRPPRVTALHRPIKRT
mmetsp:Transcript_1915/g.5271  ORF Transcript_1915/g.5271 Transcript_1915/m.5271 type:complete len:254 (-) Transcript_1915:304-1065(-)